MDPTINLCRLQNPTRPTQPLPRHSEPVVPPVADLRVGKIEDAQAVFINPEAHAELSVLKRSYHIDGYETNIKPFMNPYEGIGRSIFMNRASIKLANLDALFKFTHHTGGFARYQTYGQFTFCDIAAGPGGFTEYIQFRRPDAFGYGITLHGPLDWKKDKLDMTRFKPIYGADDSGDLYTQWKNFVTEVRATEVLGVDLVMGDGGFNLDIEPDSVKREMLATRLILTQILTAIAVIKTGGSFVLKVFDTVTEISGQLIYVMSQCFETVTIMKPMSSRPNNAERYIVCELARDETVRQPWIDLLATANEQYTDTLMVLQLVDHEALSSTFVDWLWKNNEANHQRRWTGALKVLKFIKDRQKPSVEFDVMKPLILWNLPDTPPRDLLRVLKAGYSEKSTTGETTLFSSAPK